MDSRFSRRTADEGRRTADDGRQTADGRRQTRDEGRCRLTANDFDNLQIFKKHNYLTINDLYFLKIVKILFFCNYLGLMVLRGWVLSEHEKAMLPTLE